MTDSDASQRYSRENASQAGFTIGIHGLRAAVPGAGSSSCTRTPGTAHDSRAVLRLLADLGGALPAPEPAERRQNAAPFRNPWTESTTGFPLAIH